MRALAIVLLLLPATAAADGRPEGWLFRATGMGFGYAWDRDVMCPVEGRMFVGIFELGRFVTPSLLVGGGTSIGFNALPANGCGDDGSGLRFAMGMVIGPQVDWYPIDRGLHVSAVAGFAALDLDGMPNGHGIGTTLGVGYDWSASCGAEGTCLRFGVLAQATVMRTTHGHAPVMPGLLLTVTID